MIRKIPRYFVVGICLLGVGEFVRGSGIIESAYNLIQEAGSPLTRRSTLNLTGDVACADDPGNNRTNCNVTGGGGGGGYDTIEDEGMGLTQRQTLNFTGSGVTCADDGVNFRTDCDIPGGGGGGGGSMRGPYASAPTCDMSAAGLIYWATDAALNGQCDGTDYYWEWGGTHVVPLTTSTISTWINQGAATVAGTAANTGIMMTGTQDASGTLRALVNTVPNTPYAVIGCFQTSPGNTQFGQSGMLWTNGTNTTTSIYYTYNMVSASTFPGTLINNQSRTGVTGIPSNVGALSTVVSHRICLCLQDDGTTKSSGYSYDGKTWFRTVSTGHATTLTPTHIGIYTDSSASNLVQRLNVVSWEVLPNIVFTP